MEQYYLGDVAADRREPMADFTIFNDHLASLEHRNQRLALRRLSLHADFIEKRSNGSGVPFQSLMQADFILFLHDLLTRKGQWRRWLPVTLIFASRMHSPFEVFARARSKRHLATLMLALGTDSKDALDVLMSEFREGKRQPPRWQYNSFNPLILSGWDQLGTLP